MPSDARAQQRRSFVGPVSIVGSVPGRPHKHVLTTVEASFANGAGILRSQSGRFFVRSTDLVSAQLRSRGAPLTLKRRGRSAIPINMLLPRALEVGGRTLGQHLGAGGRAVVNTSVSKRSVSYRLSISR
jgi:hypothetical protein